ncbi:MAG: hypothetical protein HRU20_26520, partial [Pseudomonadales bacterium]|nr:hypothetical protein [Pseudomonadales bacterium]
MKLQTVWQTLAVILAGYIMSGCIESNYRIDYPSNGGRYVGTQNEAAPIVDGSTEALKSEFTISYESAPSAIFKILLNGHDVSAYFVLGASSATGDIEKFKQFFRQGKNTLAVNPLGLGPNVIFNLDTAGPTLVVTRGEVSYLDHATETVPVYDSNGNVIGTEAKKISDTVEIEGFLRDPSDVSNVLELDLLQITGYDVDGKVLRSLARATVNITVNPDGSFCACGADSIDINGLSVSEDVDTQAIEKRSLLYSFRAKDVYGYQSSKEYLADNEEEDTLAIDNAVRIAVGDTFVNSLRPMIAASIHKSLADAPIDIHDVAWDDNKVCADKRGTLPGMDMTQAEVDAENEKVAENSEYIPKTPQACTAGDDGSVLPAGLNPVKTPLLGLTFDTFVRQVYMHDGSSKSVGNATLDGRKATVLLNNFKVNGDDQIDIDMVITEILVDLDIKGKIWIIPLDIPMSMYIQRIIVDTGAKVQASNKKVSVQLQNSNFDLQGIQLGKSELCVGALCIPITGLGNLLMPLIEGLIGDLLPSIMNPILEENLKKIVIGGTVTQPQNQTSFDMLLNVANLGTGNLLGPNNPFDMLVGLESVADVLVSDASVKPALGPVFTDDPVDPSLIYNALGDAGTNLTVAVSSNLINQSLAAMYAVGTSHLTIYNGKTYYGADEMTPKDPDNAGQTLA